MGEREQLIGLLDSALDWAEAGCGAVEDCADCAGFDAGRRGQNCGLALAVDYLMANGVVVQRWIPVEERLPELIPCDAGTAYSDAVNVLTSGRKVLTAIWDGENFIADAGFWDAEGEELTHWTPVLLPLPELSEGVRRVLSMQMSDHEILYEYRHAADRVAQVRILAELNAVSDAEMREKLQALGVDDLPEPKTVSPLRRHKVVFDECRAMVLYNDGLCDLDIAEALGVSRNTVADWRKRHALKVHRQKPGYVQARSQQPESQKHLDPESSPVFIPETSPQSSAYMGVGALLCIAGRVQAAFPDARITVGGCHVRDIRVFVSYNAAGEVSKAEMELMLEKS